MCRKRTAGDWRGTHPTPGGRRPPDVVDPDAGEAQPEQAHRQQDELDAQHLQAAQTVAPGQSEQPADQLRIGRSRVCACLRRSHLGLTLRGRPAGARNFGFLDAGPSDSGRRGTPPPGAWPFCASAAFSRSIRRRRTSWATASSRLCSSAGVGLSTTVAESAGLTAAPRAHRAGPPMRRARRRHLRRAQHEVQAAPLVVDRDAVAGRVGRPSPQSRARSRSGRPRSPSSWRCRRCKRMRLPTSP